MVQNQLFVNKINCQKIRDLLLQSTIKSTNMESLVFVGFSKIAILNLCDLFSMFSFK